MWKRVNTPIMGKKWLNSFTCHKGTCLLSLLCVLNIQCMCIILRFSKDPLFDSGKVHHEFKFTLLNFDFLLYLDPKQGDQQGTAAWRNQRTALPMWRRGRRGRIHARLKPRATVHIHCYLACWSITSIFSKNKVDELRIKMTTQHEISECCALILTETWLSDNTPDSTIRLQIHNVGTAYRPRGRSKVPASASVWTTDGVRMYRLYCSADMEVLMTKCRPFNFARECCVVYPDCLHPVLGRPGDSTAWQDWYNGNVHLWWCGGFAGDLNYCNLYTIHS